MHVGTNTSKIRYEAVLVVIFLIAIISILFITFLNYYYFQYLSIQSPLFYHTRKIACIPRVSTEIRSAYLPYLGTDFSTVYLTYTVGNS